MDDQKRKKQRRTQLHFTDSTGRVSQQFSSCSSHFRALKDDIGALNRQYLTGVDEIKSRLWTVHNQRMAFQFSVNTWLIMICSFNLPSNCLVHNFQLSYVLPKLGIALALSVILISEGLNLRQWEEMHTHAPSLLTTSRHAERKRKKWWKQRWVFLGCLKAI